jgi:hypothetical protein
MGTKTKIGIPVGNLAIANEVLGLCENKEITYDLLSVIADNHGFATAAWWLPNEAFRRCLELNKGWQLIRKHTKAGDVLGIIHDLIHELYEGSEDGN